MCWTGNVYDRHIAKSPKKVFKILERPKKRFKASDGNFIPEYISPFYGFRYVLGNEYAQNFGMVHSDKLYIMRGLHSYSAKTCRIVHSSIRNNILSVIHKSRGVISNYEWVRDRSFVSLSNRPELALWESVVIECTIPVGAEYYENERGKIVSNRLILNREVEI